MDVRRGAGVIIALGAIGVVLAIIAMVIGAAGGAGGIRLMADGIGIVLGILTVALGFFLRSRADVNR
jgi:hypothetical protein